MTARTCLITGASAGIGRAFAREFARRGFNLALVARREPKLEEIAEEINREFDVKVDYFPVDLAEADSGERLDLMLKARGVTVDALVNNAGYGLNGGLLDSSWDEHMAMQQVMLTGYLELCYRLLPSMIERGYGRIINVSSVAALFPAGRGNLYTPIKKYVTDLSLAIDFEFREKGVHCLALHPGFTYTEFHDVMGVREQASNNFPKFMWQSAEEVANEGVEAVMKGEVFFINGRFNRILVTIMGNLPRFLQFRSARKADPFRDQ